MKKWYKSKTIQLNAIAASLMALEASTGLLKPLFGSNVYAVFAVALAVINAYLRVITTQPIIIGKQDAKCE